MTSGELPRQTEPAASNDIATLLVNAETDCYRTLFRDLERRVGRVELLGVDDASRFSYHEWFESEGEIEGRLLFYGELANGVGRQYTVIVNREVHEEPRQLEIEEFLYTPNDGGRAVRMTSCDVCSPQTRKWANLFGSGPHLRKRGNSASFWYGEGYERRALPVLVDLAEQDRSLRAGAQLYRILGWLHTTTRNEDITRLANSAG